MSKYDELCEVVTQEMMRQIEHEVERRFLSEISSYPITIIKDRYNGTYSGGLWLAFNMTVEDLYEKSEGAFDDEDVVCMNFWHNEAQKFIIGKGKTPDEAIVNLCKQRQHLEP